MKTQQTNILIHKGVALKMDWVEQYDDINLQLAEEKAIAAALKERTEYEDQEQIINLVSLQTWDHLDDEILNDGIYVVDLPETEVVEQYTYKGTSIKWIDHVPGLAYIHECFDYRKVARFKEENERTKTQQALDELNKFAKGKPLEVVDSANIESEKEFFNPRLAERMAYEWLAPFCIFGFLDHERTSEDLLKQVVALMNQYASNPFKIIDVLNEECEAKNKEIADWTKRVELLREDLENRDKEIAELKQQETFFNEIESQMQVRIDQQSKEIAELRETLDIAVSGFKERLKAAIKKQRGTTYWLGESKEKALDLVLELLDTTE